MNTNDAVGAFALSENLKLEIFSEAVTDASGLSAHLLTADASKKENEFVLKIKGLRKEMDSFFRNNRNDEYWAKDRELKAVKASHDEFVEELRKTSPEYTLIKYPRPLKPQDINLKPNEVLLEFEVTERFHIFSC